MATVDWDLVNGNNGEVNKDGFTGARVCHVSDLTAVYGYDKIAEAIVEIDIPLGTIHPSYTDSALQSYILTSVSTNDIQLSLTYIPVINVPHAIQITSSANSTQTNIDKDGNTISVEYTYPSDYKHDPNLADKTEKVGKTVDTRIPTITLTIRKRELITGLQVAIMANSYVSTVNLAGWNLFPGDAARSWMCSSITGDWIGRYIDGGVYQVYDVTYVFDTQFGGWDTEVIFIDPNTGEPPDPDTYSGSPTIKTIKLMPESNFTNLTSDVS